MPNTKLNSIYVSIVEDIDRFRDIFKFIIDGAEDMKCISAYADCESALINLPEDNPDIILMDIDLGSGKMSGIEAVKILKEKLPKTEILMLTVHKDFNDYIFQSLSAGASGYLTKDISPEELLAGIRQTYYGGASMSPEIAKKVVQAFQKPKNEINTLTEQEKRILTLAAADKVDKEIAGILSISHETVRFHFKNIYDKLHVHSKHGAVSKAIKDNLL